MFANYVLPFFEFKIYFFPAHVLLMNLTDAVAFFGGFVTKDIYRRMGIGYHLFNKAISLSRGRKVVLESTWQMPQKYEKRGFVKEFNFYKVSGILRSWTESSSCGHQKPPWGTSYMIRPVKEDNIADVCMYDKSISGNNREPFLRKVLLNPNTIAYCAVSDRGDVLGLLAVRKVDLNRTSIFSFYASDYNIAEVLLRTVVSNPVVVGSALSLYIPEINPECMKLFQLCGLERDQSGQKVVRMSNKDFSENIPWQKVYSVCCVGYFNV